MTRDDLDRVLIVVPAITLLAAPFAISYNVEGEDRWADQAAILSLAAVVLYLLLLILGAFVLRRDAAWAVPWLRITALALFGVALTMAIGTPLGLLPLGTSALLLIGALRVRVPPPSRARVVGDPRGLGEERESPTPFAASNDWRDDADLRVFADRAAHLDGPDLAYLAAAWRSADARARDAAHRAVREALGAPHRAKAFDAITAEIRAWSQAAVGPWTWEWGAMTDIDRGDRRRAAIPALVDAAAAIITRDVIPQEERDALLGPWLATLAAPPVVDGTAPGDVGHGHGQGDVGPVGNGHTPATS